MNLSTFECFNFRIRQLSNATTFESVNFGHWQEDAAGILGLIKKYDANHDLPLSNDEMLGRIRHI